MQLNLSNQEMYNEKTENDEDNLSQRRNKNRKDKPINKLPKIAQVQKGYSDDESDLENNINTSINLPKINQNQIHKDKDKNVQIKNINSKTITTKKNQLNTNNSNASLQNNRKY